MWATGINRLIDASEIWLDIVRQGKVTPSAAVQAWADMPGQGAMPLER